VAVDDRGQVKPALPCRNVRVMCSCT
jgi:hypothetical protein